MARFAFKPSQKITLGVLILFTGLCILSSTYFNEKKFEVFDDMNELYYEQLVELEMEIDELESETENTENEPSDIQDEPSNGNAVTTTTTQKITLPPIDYTKYYVGYLRIPKIDLKKGYTEITNKYNNVNRNIQVIESSDYPNTEKGNMIIAAHSGSSSVSFFKDLYKLEVNDEVFISYNDTEYQYTIRDIYLVPKTGKIAIRRSKEKTTLTLITCTKGDKTAQTVYIAERD